MVFVCWKKEEKKYSKEARYREIYYQWHRQKGSGRVGGFFDTNKANINNDFMLQLLLYSISDLGPLALSDFDTRRM